MKRYFIIIPKNELTDDMRSLFLSDRNSNDSNYTMGMIFASNIPNIFSNYTVLTRSEYSQKLADEPELWVTEKLRQ